MPNLGGWEIVAIVVLIFLLFGARKLPEAARGLGRSLRIFKAEIKDPNDQEGRDAAEGLPPVTTQQVIAQTPVVPSVPVVQPVVQQPSAQQHYVQPVVQPVVQPDPQQPVQQTEQIPVAPPVQQPTDR